MRLAGLAGIFTAGAVIFATNTSQSADKAPAPVSAIGAHDEHYSPRPSGSLTFNKDIAPIVFSQCSSCHHPGQPAPFALLTYRDVSKRARQIRDVTLDGYMPPWLPEHGFGKFLNERRLTADQKGMIAQWAAEGAVEGSGTPPPAPQFADGWVLGKPDLVVTMPEEYELGAEGNDVYRNFVIPVPGNEDRYVRALEFAPGNSKIVHHAFIKVDRNRSSRILDEQEAGVGFSGMNVPAEMPMGQFLCWQPGKMPSVAPEGLSWLLPRNSDLILQAHLNRSGKTEKLRSSIGLYFTNAPPTKTCVKAALVCLALDILPGDSNYVVNNSITMPADAEVLSILPHAHYLATKMESSARLPDGRTEPLLYIKRWDFKWQGDYQYARPVRLPKGTVLQMRFTYDNTTNNLRNPNPVPKRVSYGPQSSDEMCELWLQLLVANAQDAAAVKSAFNDHLQQAFRAGAEHRLTVDPDHVESHLQLARILFTEGNHREAITHLRRAIQLDPKLDAPHYELGVIFRSENRLAEAKAELDAALKLNSNNSKAYGHLGFVYASMGDAAAADRCFRRCLELDPDDTLVRDSLAELQKYRGTSK